jgi:hypothetical protein
MVDVYRGVLERYDSVSLRRFPHYVLPGHNLHEKIDEKNGDGSRVFPYNCMQPVPLLPPSEVSSKGEEMLCISYRVIFIHLPLDLYKYGNSHNNT